MSESDRDRQRSEILDRLGQNGENLELLNDELTGRLDRQEDANSKVDTKVAFLLGLIATATQFLATRHFQPVLGGLAFAGYAVAFGLGIPALAIRAYPEIKPRELFEGYYDKGKVQTLLALCSVRVSNLESNHKKHEQKSAWWWRSFVVTIAALVFSVGAIVDAGTHDNSTGQQHPTPVPSAASASSHAAAPDTASSGSAGAERH